MNEIKIITELCAEDRARLDRLAAALEKLQPLEPVNTNIDPELIAKAQTLLDEAHGDQEPVTFEVPVETPAEPESVPEEAGAPDDEPDVKEVPEHTQAELQQKVISLVSGGKKDEVTKIIRQYALRVSAIPAEKINEVWDKLTALEG